MTSDSPSFFFEASVKKFCMRNRTGKNSWFENAPISLWLQDYSRVKAYLDALHQQEAPDMRAFLRAHPESLMHGLHCVRIQDANTASAKLHGTNQKDLLRQTFPTYIPNEARNRIGEEFALITEGHFSFTWHGISLPTLHNGRVCAHLHWSADPSFHDVLVGITVGKEQQRAWPSILAEWQIEQQSKRFGSLIGTSSQMREIYHLVAKIALENVNVIIYGETGTGKELVAKAIHDCSRRAHRPFVPINCGAVAESLFEREFFGHRKGSFTGADRHTSGFFEQAEGGTLFLDEIGELSPTMQVKLLRVLQDNKFTPIGGTPQQADVRIVAATNKHLPELLGRGRIREDFFFRVNVVSISLPPLRERREDIPLLIDHFLRQKEWHFTLPKVMMEQFIAYHWPGNVRELENALQHVYITESLPFLFNQSVETDTSLRSQIEHCEREVILTALRQNQGNRTLTAHQLGIDPKTLYRKLKQCGIVDTFAR